MVVVETLIETDHSPAHHTYLQVYERCFVSTLHRSLSFIYWYYAWVKNENLTFAASLPGAITLIVGCILLAWLCLKAYDDPVRRWLTRRWLQAAAK